MLGAQMPIVRWLSVALVVAALAALTHASAFAATSTIQVSVPSNVSAACDGGVFNFPCAVTVQANGLDLATTLQFADYPGTGDWCFTPDDTSDSKATLTFAS